MKHTQGDWEVRKCGVDHRIIVNNPAKFIASTRTPGDKRGLTVSGEEDEANANLIAAAPELLAACEKALFRLEQCQKILKQDDKYSATTTLIAQDHVFIDKAVAKANK